MDQNQAVCPNTYKIPDLYTAPNVCVCVCVSKEVSAGYILTFLIGNNNVISDVGCLGNTSEG